MNIPHKWPGKKKIIAMCAYAKMIEVRPPDLRVDWDRIAASSANKLKHRYGEIKYLVRTVVEFHQYQQRGKDNG